MKRHIFARARLLAVPALLCAGVIAGCGSSSATDDTTTSAMTTTVTRTETGTTPAQSHSRTTPASSTTAGESSGATSGSQGTPAAGGPCRAAGLALTYLGGQGATGHGELGFSLRNTSSVPCRTYGYPGIQFLGAGNAKLPTTPTHTTSDFFGHVAEAPVTIAPGGRASFRLGVSHVPSGGGSCTTAHGLQVIAPDDTATLTVTIPGGAAECGGTATVSPVAAGAAAFAH